MNKIEPIGIGGLHRGLSIPEIYIENTKLHNEVNGLRKQRRKVREKNKKLQSNWNELEEWLKELQKFKGINQQGFSWGVAQEVLDKMNEIKERKNEK